MKNILTPLQAFNSMRKFLERYYKRTNSDDIGALLSDMQFLHDNMTADPATWHDWLKSVNYVLYESKNDLK